MYVTTQLDNETEGARPPGQGLGQGNLDKVTLAMTHGQGHHGQARTCLAPWHGTSVQYL